ncbi:MAG: hypothetical protein ABMB14_14830, partial [Myxococcota bacterium]
MRFALLSWVSMSVACHAPDGDLRVAPASLAPDDGVALFVAPRRTREVTRIRSAGAVARHQPIT